MSYDYGKYNHIGLIFPYDDYQVTVRLPKHVRPVNCVLFEFSRGGETFRIKTKLDEYDEIVKKHGRQHTALEKLGEQLVNENYKMGESGAIIDDNELERLRKEYKAETNVIKTSTPGFSGIGNKVEHDSVYCNTDNITKGIRIIIYSKTASTLKFENVTNLIKKHNHLGQLVVTFDYRGVSTDAQNKAEFTDVFGITTIGDK